MTQNIEYFTTAQVAKLLGISRVAVFKRIKNGALKAQKIGRNYAIPKSEFVEGAGSALSENQKRILDRGVAKTVKEYAETLRLLGKE